MKLDADTWRVLGVYGLWIICFVLLILSLTVFYGALMAFSSLGGAVFKIESVSGQLRLILWSTLGSAEIVAVDEIDIALDHRLGPAQSGLVGDVAQSAADRA